MSLPIRAPRGTYIVPGTPRVDFNHPLARGLGMIWLASNPAFNLVTGAVGTLGSAINRSSGPLGAELKITTNGAATGVTFSNYQPITTSTGTGTGGYTVACIANPSPSSTQAYAFSQRANDNSLFQMEMVFNYSIGNSTIVSGVTSLLEYDGGNGAQFSGTSVSKMDGTYHVYVGRRKTPGSAVTPLHSLFVDGVDLSIGNAQQDSYFPDITTAGTPAFAIGAMAGLGNPWTTNGANCSIPIFASWNRALSDWEIALWSSDPTCFLISPEDEVAYELYAPLNGLIFIANLAASAQIGNAIPDIIDVATGQAAQGILASVLGLQVTQLLPGDIGTGVIDRPSQSITSGNILVTPVGSAGVGTLGTLTQEVFTFLSGFAGSNVIGTEIATVVQPKIVGSSGAGQVGSVLFTHVVNIAGDSGTATLGTTVAQGQMVVVGQLSTGIFGNIVAIATLRGLYAVGMVARLTIQIPALIVLEGLSTTALASIPTAQPTAAAFAGQFGSAFLGFPTLISSVIPNAFVARQLVITNPLVQSEIVAIEIAIQLAIHANQLAATVNTSIMTTDTDYYNVWQGITLDREKNAEMLYVVRYFLHRGYYVVQLQSQTTNNLFYWEILW